MLQFELPSGHRSAGGRTFLDCIRLFVLLYGTAVYGILHVDSR